VSSLPALTFLNLQQCYELTDERLRAVSSCTALTYLNLTECRNVTAAGVQALRDTTAAPNLEIEWEECDFECTYHEGYLIV
jgi:F-box/leucine-rich repeat protein 14